MSSKKNERVEQLKKECIALDTALRTEKEPNSSIDIVENYIKDALDDNIDPEPTAYILNEMLPKLVNTLLKRTDFEDEDFLDRVTSVFQLVIDLALQFINHDFLELDETLSRIFTPNQPFYLRYGVDEVIEEDERIYNAPQERIIIPSSDYSWYFVSNVKFFAKVNGFNAILSRFQDEEEDTEGLPLLAIKSLLKAIVKIRDLVSVDYLGPYAEKVQTVIYEHILGLSDDELKNEDRKNITDINQMVETLIRTTKPEVASESAEKFNLSIALKCFQSPYLEKRLVGLNDIKDVINNVLRKQEWQKKQQQYQSEGHVVNHPTSQTWITSQYLIDWILENQILETLYDKGMHPELVKRSIEIAKFLAFNNQLDRKYIDMIWESAQGKHESIKHIILNSIAELAQTLNVNDLDYLYDKIKQIPYNEYDTQTLLMIRNFSAGAINTVINNPNVKKKKFYGLEILWALIQEETDTPNEISLQAHLSFHDFLNWPSCHTQRVPFMELCIENLQKFKSVPQSLRLLGKIISTYPEKFIKKADCVPSVIEWLNTTHNLLELLFKDLVHFKSVAKQLYSNTTEKSNFNNYIIGKQTYISQIGDRLEFLEYILGNSVLDLNVNFIDLFWENLVIGALSTEEQDSAFRWLENARGANNKLFAPFNEESTQYIFVQKVPQLDLSSLSTAGFSFFEFYFRYVNWKNNRFEQDARNLKFYIVLSFELIGMSNLWSIALQARNPEVGQQAIILLNNLHKNLSVDLAEQVGPQREEFVRICMNYVSQALQDINNPSNGLVIERCLTILRTFLDEFELKTGAGTQKHGAVPRGPPMKIKVAVVTMTTVDLEVYPHDTIGSIKQKVSEKVELPASMLRMIASGKELKDDNETVASVKIVNGATIYAAKRIKTEESAVTVVDNSKPKVITPNDIKDEKFMPSYILSKQNYFDQLFALLNIEGVAQKAWELVMLLPTNKKIYDQIFTLQEGSPQTNWENLLDTSSTYTLLYSLQIVDLLLTITNDDSDTAKNDKAIWREKFLSRGGLNYLLNILTTQSFHEISKGNKRKTCLALVLKIVNNFLLIPRTEESEKDLPAILNQELFASLTDRNLLIDKLMKILWHSAAPEPTQTFSTTEPLGSPDAADITVSGLAIALLVSVLVAHSELLHYIFQHPSFDIWFSTLILYTEEKKIREQGCSGIYSLCKLLTSVGNGVIPHVFFLEKLLMFLGRIEPTSSTCEEYFELLTKLVNESCEGKANGKPSDFVNLLQQLVVMIKQHPIVEARNWKVEDCVLVGLFNLTRVVISKDVGFKLNVGHSTKGNLIQELFHKCLFEIATSENHGLYAPPKCKSPKARKTCFRLLTELCRDAPENFEELTEQLLKHHSNEVKRSSWNYLPNSNTKSSTGYVGLSNLGATCYMNSLMQQLYMVPPLRYGLLQVPIEERIREEADKALSGVQDEELREKKRNELFKDNLLYQMQHLLANLQESEKKFFDTREFCKSYKYEGQPVNPSVQMDADEFFNMLFDRLETLTKGTKQESLTKDFFGGTLCNQVISRECEHVSEREEGFYTLSLEVKNKKNILESLGLYVEGDMLDGDNKYSCSQCQKKVDAKKRTCINTLPDNLIVHLKRFEFDLEQMRRIKVNDYCEFPMELNLEPYTKEGLAKRENPELADKPLPHDQSYYEYELSGILVHTGTADTGHYYSFIRQRDHSGAEYKWYQFNDTDVEPFDPKDIGKNCYGGYDSMMQYDAVQKKEVPRFSTKIYNAYMLFYERKNPVHKESIQTLTPIQESQFVPKPIFEKIWEENSAFLTEKNIFDPDYFYFVWSIVSLAKPPTSVIPYDETSGNFDPVKRAIELGTRFVIVTMARSKEKSGLKEYVNQLKNLYSKHIPACKWYIESMANDTTWPRQLLFQCTSTETRDSLAGLMVHVLNLLIPYERPIYNEQVELMEIDTIPKVERSPLAPEMTGTPKAIVLRFMDNLLSMLKEGYQNWHNFSHYFLLFKEFSSAGTPEKQFLLQRSVIAQFIDFYLADDSPYAPLFKTKRPKMGDKFTFPNLTYMLECLVLLVQISNINPLRPSSTGEILPLTNEDSTCITTEKFYERSLRENIHPKASAAIACHIAWENLEFSGKLINICCQGINAVDHDGFRPYFEVMTPLFALQDSFQADRVDYGLRQYLDVVDSNSQYVNATYSSIKYLVETSKEISFVTEWLWSYKQRWIEKYLFIYSSQIRDMTVALIMSLIPEFPNNFATTDNQMIPVDPSSVAMSTYTTQRSKELYEYLLSLLPTIKPHLRADIESGKSAADYDSNIFKAAQYFKLLSALVVSDDEKAMLHGKFEEFWGIYQYVDGLHYPCDENKKELVDYWYHCTLNYPDNVTFITNNEKNYNKLLDFFISISPSDKFVRYNGSALPAFYGIMYQCASHSQKFLNHLATHQNWEWALTHLYQDSPDYPAVSAKILDIIKLISNSGLPVANTFRIKHITTALGSDKMNSNPTNILRYLEQLLKTPEDGFHFARLNGFNHIQKFMDTRIERDTEIDRLGFYLELSLTILNKAVSWWTRTDLTDQQKQNRIQIFSIWDSPARVSMVTLSLQLLRRFVHREKLLQKCYSFILVLANSDLYCLNSTLRFIYQIQQQSSKHEDLVSIKLKDDNYYNFVKSVCDAASIATEKQLLATAVEIVVTHAQEVIRSPEFSRQFFGLLEKLFDTPLSRDLVVKSNSVHQFISFIYLHERQTLDDLSCDQLLNKIMPIIRKEMSDEIKGKLLENLHEQLSLKATQLKLAIDSNDNLSLESSLEYIIHLLKAVYLYYLEETNKEFVTKNKELLTQLQSITQLENLKVNEKANELSMILGVLLA